MRPRYGFFANHSLCDAYLAHYGRTSARAQYRLDIGILPELAERFREVNGLHPANLIPVRVRLEDDSVLVLTMERSTVHLRERLEPASHNALVSWEASFSERSAPDIISRLETFGRYPVKAHILEKELRVLLPRGVVKRSVVFQPSISDNVAHYPEPVQHNAMTTIQAPETRTLLLEDEGGEIGSYALPKRIAESVAALVAPYKS